MAGPGLFEYGGLLGAIAPGVAPQLNPLTLTGLMMQGPQHGLGGLTLAANMAAQHQQRQMRGQAMFESMRRAAQEQEYRRQMMNLRRQQLAHQMSQPTGTSLQQNLAAAGLSPGTPEYQAAMMEAVTKPGTTVNVGRPVEAGEAAAYAGMETIIGNLDALSSDLEAGADLSGFKGLLSEWHGAPTISGAALRAIFGPMDDAQEQAIRRAKMIEAQVVDFINTGVATDEDIRRLKEAMGLIGGPDTEKAVKDLREMLSTRYSRRQQMRGQALQPEPARGIKFLGFEGE